MAVKPNRPVLVSLVILAVLVGLLPWALYAGFERLLPLLGLGAGAVALPSLRRHQTGASEQPTPGEFLLGGWSAVLFPTIGSTLALSSYFLVWFVGHLFDLKLHTAAGWTSFSVAAVFGLAAGSVAAENLASKLYPASAGSSSPFFALLVERRRLLSRTLAAFIPVILLLLITNRFPAELLAAIQTLFLLVTSMPLASLKSGEQRSPGKSRALDAITKALASANLVVIASPRTGRPEIDPLVATIDLLARKDDRGLAIEVKAGAHRAKPVEWYEAATLRSGARALEQFIKEKSEQVVRIQPLMLLIDRERTEGLTQFLTDSSLAVLELPAAAVQAVTEQAGEAELAELAGLVLSRWGEVPARPEARGG